MSQKLTPTDLYKFAEERKYDGPNGRNFHKDTEEAFEFADLPEKVKSRIHWLAYEGGHAAGYSDMVTQYYDLVDLVNLTIAEQKAAMT